MINKGDSSMKKIAIFVDNLNIGGIQKSLINIINTIDLNKYKIDIYLFNKNIFYKDRIPKEINIIYLEKHKYIFKFIPFNFAFRINRRNISTITKQYDIAIDFDSYQFQTAYNTIQCPAKTKIMWIHNDVYQENNKNIKYFILHLFMKKKYKFFDKFVGVSEGVIEPFKKLNKINNKEMLIIPNLINTDEIFELANKKVDDIKIDPNKYNLVSVGRICYQKGYDIFLKNYKEIIKKRKDIHFYLIGDGDKLKQILRLVEKYKLNDYFTHIKKTPNPFKYEKLMDGFVLTSRYEGQGMVLLEAKALGLEVFIPKNIEKYNGYNIKGVTDIEQSIIKAKKKNKKQDSLKDYNNNIIKKLTELLDAE